jgi:hypothetical protein
MERSDRHSITAPLDGFASLAMTVVSMKRKMF